MYNGDCSYRRFLSGDDGAFDDIMREYFDGLVFFVNRYVNDLHAAEDIAIDVFSYVLVHKTRYNFKVSLKTYLFMLGKSRALNYIKHRNRIKMVSLCETHGNDADYDALAGTVLADERKRAVSAALDTLSPDMREAVHLVYFEELSYSEAARVMKKTHKQIDNLLYRAKGCLRTVLGREGELLL